MNKFPSVSVIIIVYNGELYLSDAIKSVLQQKYQPLEIILVDDGSTDKSASIAKSYSQVNYFHQPNFGVSAARNLGISKAHGELITFLDYDDLMLPDTISIRSSYMVKHSDVSCLLTMHRSFLEPGVKKPGWVRNIEFEEGVFGTGYMMVRKNLFDQINGFDSAFRTGEDTEFVFRVRKSGLIIHS